MAVAAAAIRRVFETASLRAPENAIGFVLWRVTSRYQREMDRALEALNLTNLQFVTLALTGWFERTGGAATQAELARFGGIHPMQLSLMLKALEGKRFILRKRSKVDSRAKQVALTKQGLDTLRRALPIAVAVQSKLFGEEGRKGGSLHEILTQIDTRLGQDDAG